MQLCRWQSAALALTMVLMVPVRPARAAAVSGQEIAEGLTCQCGCGLTVANCNHPNCSFSVPMREQIDAMLAKRMGRAEIIAYFRKQYGEKILSAPTTQGFNLLAWTMPFVALLLGGGMVVLMMGRWRKPPPPRVPGRRNRRAVQSQTNSIPSYASDWNANCGNGSEPCSISPPC